MYRTLLLLQQQAILISFIEKMLFFNTERCSEVIRADLVSNIGWQERSAFR